MFDDQADFLERFEWGEEGLRRLAPHADVVVVVDVLSFASAVDIAVGRGAIVFPYPERGDAAAAFALQVDAILAGARVKEGYSLSPTSLLSLPQGSRLVLPSPNGARLVTIADNYVKNVLLGSLRNASAVAGCCRSLGDRIVVIAAGERWTGGDAWGGTLRPAVEDLIGAGSILSALSPRRPSPEAVAALAAFRATADDLPSHLRACASGKELIERGFAADVSVAAELDVSQVVPRLEGGRFVGWTAAAP